MPNYSEVRIPTARIASRPVSGGWLLEHQSSLPINGIVKAFRPLQELWRCGGCARASFLLLNSAVVPTSSLHPPKASKAFKGAFQWRLASTENCIRIYLANAWLFATSPELLAAPKQHSGSHPHSYEQPCSSLLSQKTLTSV